MIKAIKAMQTPETDTNILDNAIYQISIGDYQSIKPEHSTGIYKEKIDNNRARYFKDMMFPKFSRERYGFPNPEHVESETLIFHNGKIFSIEFKLKSGPSKIVFI